MPVNSASAVLTVLLERQMLIDTPLGLTICDFKTTSREEDKPEAWLADHQDQLVLIASACEGWHMSSSWSV